MAASGSPASARPARQRVQGEHLHLGITGVTGVGEHGLEDRDGLIGAASAVHRGHEAVGQAGVVAAARGCGTSPARPARVRQRRVEIALRPQDPTETQAGEGGDPEVARRPCGVDRLVQGARRGVEVAVLLLGSAEVGPVVGLAAGEPLALGGRGGPVEVGTGFGEAVVGLGRRPEHGVGVDEEPGIADVVEQPGRFAAGVRWPRLGLRWRA